MKELNANQLDMVAGGYTGDIGSDLLEGIGCSIGGAIIGSWLFAITGGRAAARQDLVGIGGGLTALAGMLGGAVVGAVAGAVVAPFYGWETGLVKAKEILTGLMQGLPS